MIFFLDFQVLSEVRANFPDDEPILMFWCRRSEYTETQDEYHIKYPVLEDDDDGHYVKTYTVDKCRYANFMLARMYTKEAKSALYARLISFNVRTPVTVPPPPSRERIRDEGQSKILTDVIQTVQHIAFEDGDKILVVGSCAEGGNCAGMSYQVISHMTHKKIDIDLYDVNDVESQYQLGTVTYNHHDVNYTYSEGDEKKYKLVLDDAWTEQYERVWDPDGKFYQFPFFSIKNFPYYTAVTNRKYYQAYHTGNHEDRIVSIPPTFHYFENNIIGHCKICVELKYILHHEYESSFYDFFMGMHKINCITKNKRLPFMQPYELGDREWFIVDNLKEFLTKRKAKSMVWDPILGYSRMYPDKNKIKGQVIVFSSTDNVRPDLYDSGIVAVIEGSIINTKDLPGLIYKHSFTLNEKDIELNLVHAAVTKQKNQIRKTNHEKNSALASNRKNKKDLQDAKVHLYNNNKKKLEQKKFKDKKK